MSEIFQPINQPELFFGIVAPIGCKIKDTVNALEASLKELDYRVVRIKVTDVFKVLKKSIKVLKNGVECNPELEETPLERRYETYIQFGDILRSQFNDDSILVYPTIQQIIHWREFIARKHGLMPPSKVAYVIEQFKRKEEIELLRSIYGDLFFQISIYSRRMSRVDRLARTISASHNSIDHDSFRSRAESLVTVDHNEREHEHGQRIAEVFHEADFIINTDTDISIQEQIGRFVHLIFGSTSISPNKTEYGLYIAKSASLRSLDLSRQVGAAIFTKEGEIITLGANEVPKAGGGTYWCDSPIDNRDFKRGFDSNDKRKKELLTELCKELIDSPNIDEILKKENIKKSQFMDALEYGRVIHAEMSAICDAARLGRPLDGTTLFSTTFPCHMCAKHIIGAGIKEVVFLEPYPKSLATDLHGDSIEIEGQSRGDYETYKAVKFRHFWGVSPRRYRDLFEWKRRKDSEGTFVQWREGNPQPIYKIRIPIYLELEVDYVKSIWIPFLKKLGLDTEAFRPFGISEGGDEFGKLKA